MARADTSGYPMQNISSASSHSPASSPADPIHQESDPGPCESRTITSGVPERELPRQPRRRPGAQAPTTSGQRAMAASRFNASPPPGQHLRIARLIVALQAWANSCPPSENRLRRVVALQIGNAFAYGSEELCLKGSGRASAERLSTLPDCLGNLQSLKRLDVSNHALSTLPGLPPALTHLHVGGNHLRYLPLALLWMEQLQVLRAPANLFRSIPALPNTLVELDLAMNGISELGALPVGLKSLWMSKNLIVEAATLPNGLINLDLSQNRLVSLAAVPKSLKHLDVGCNNLTALPDLPEGLHGLCASRNWFRNLPAIPDSVRILDLMGNQLHELPQLSGTFASIALDGNQLSELPEHFELIMPSESGLAINVSSNPWSAASLQRLDALKTRFAITHLDAAAPAFQFHRNEGNSAEPGLPLGNRTPPFDYDNEDWSVIARALQDPQPL